MKTPEDFEQPDDNKGEEHGSNIIRKDIGNVSKVPFYPAPCLQRPALCAGFGSGLATGFNALWSRCWVYETTIPRPDEILKFKPKNSTLKDSKFLLAVAHWGLEGAIARDFKGWLIHHQTEAEYFGDFEREYKRQFPRREGEVRTEWWTRFSHHILDGFASRELKKLGRFGAWVKKSGIT